MELRKYFTSILVTLALVPTFAHSALITTYTDRTLFLDALNNLAMIEEDFNNQSLNLFSTSFSLDLGDFIVSSGDVANDQIGIVDFVDTSHMGNNQSVDGSQFFGITGGGGGPSFNIAFDTQRFVFGFDWLDGDATDSYALTVLGQTFESPPFGRSTVDRGFFGVISDVAFQAVDFGQTAAGGVIGGFGIDNLITSSVDILTCAEDPTLPECTPQPVPEPTTLAIFAWGIIGLASRRSLLVNKK